MTEMQENVCTQQPRGAPSGLHPALPPGLHVGPSLLRPLSVLGWTPGCPTSVDDTQGTLPGYLQRPAPGF